MLDLTDIYYAETLVLLNDIRINQTDINGIATFNKVTLIDVKNNTCVRFIFVVGDPSSIIERSAPTDLFCFRNNIQVILQNLNSIE